MVYVTLLQDVSPLGRHTFRGLSTTHGRVVSVRFFRNSPRYNPFYEQYNYSVWLLRTTVHNVMRTITYNHPQRYANNYVQPSTTLCEQLRTTVHNVMRTITYNHPQRYANNYVQLLTTSGVLSSVVQSRVTQYKASLRFTVTATITSQIQEKSSIYCLSAPSTKA